MFKCDVKVLWCVLKWCNFRCLGGFFDVVWGDFEVVWCYL